MKRRLLVFAWLFSAAGTIQAAPVLVSVEPLRLMSVNEPLKLSFSEALGGTNMLVLLSPLDQPAQVTDLSALGKADGAALTLDLVGAGLRPDVYQVRLFAGAAAVESGRAIIEVATQTGAAPAAGKVTLRLDVGGTAQLAESVRGSQSVSDRARYRDLTLQGSVNAEDGGEDWMLRAQLQLAGASYRPQTVGYGTLGRNALKVDIPSYLIEGGLAATRFSLGHINADMHPLLYSGVGNRGVALQHRLPLGIDLGFTAQSARFLSGHRDFFGLGERHNQHRSLGLGYDFYPSHPGRLRLDVTAAESSVISFSGLPDQSRGHGARLVWRNESGTVRAEGVLARSDFEPAPGSLVSGFPAAKGNARTLELGYDALRDWQWRQHVPVSLALGARSEYASPFYRSLGSYFSANYRLDAATATIRTGPATTQLQRIRRFDNVDGNRTFLRNRVDASSLNIQLPLAEMVPKLFPAAVPPDSNSVTDPQKPAAAFPAVTGKWWPTLSYLRQLTHGHGDADFIPLGYFKADLPDIYIENQSLGLAWQFETVTVSLRTDRTAQDNRQAGFEGQSTRDRRHSVVVDWRPWSGLSISLAYDPSLNYRFDSNVQNDARQVRGSVNWTLAEKWQVALDLNHSADFDSADTRYNRQNTSQIQVSRRFDLPGPAGRRLPGQAYLRWSDSRSFNATLGNPALEPGVRRLQLGFTVSVF